MLPLLRGRFGELVHLATPALMAMLRLPSSQSRVGLRLCGAAATVNRRRAGGVVYGVALFAVMPLVTVSEASTSMRISEVLSPTEVGTYEKLEITFDVHGSVATNTLWPYDASPPAGVPQGHGITVNAVFTDPDGREHAQPAFRAEEFLEAVRQERDWHLPTGVFRWTVRFAPHRPGTWRFTLVATDASGTVSTPPRAISVTPSRRRGFVRVSARDRRYFEFDDGSAFAGRGVQLQAFLDRPRTVGAQRYGTLADHGIDFVRVSISSIFGAAWNSWIGGRNQRGGYLPYTGLVPFTDPVTRHTSLALRVDHEPEGDVGWFDACRMQLWWWDEAESVKRHTRYRIRIEYSGQGITGPRVARHPRFGLVAKLGGWFPDCHQPGTSAPVTDYGTDTAGMGYIEGTWDSGNHDFLPQMYLALENVATGTAWIRTLSLREDLGGGKLGPELMVLPSMARGEYIPEERAYAFDRIVEAAERHGVSLKVVVMEKEDDVYRKLDDAGNWTATDNRTGFYGLGRRVNRTRWLQQSWWRYLQARWGYSTAIHSWELTNEGDPGSVRHFELTDEFGKYMHCRVFGIDPGPGDAAPCRVRHPNAHLVTTSFWHSFPTGAFWASSKYPNVDYADLHAYVSTSYAPLSERERMQWDTAHFHVWHSRNTAAAETGKPVVRGEAGLDSPRQQSDTALGLDRDRRGIWLHNYLWATLDAGGLHELYWWTDHIWNERVDHRPVYRAVANFMADVPLNEGGYVDWGGTVDNEALRIVGQKNAAVGRMHLWVQNRQHTWRSVVDGADIQPVSGEIVVPGFTPGARFTLERWDTYVTGGAVVSSEPLLADPTGKLRIRVGPLQADLALKVRAERHGPDGRGTR